MPEDIRLIELMTEMLIEQKGVSARLDKIEGRLDNIEKRLDKLENQQTKTNLAIGELRLSVMRLADIIDQIPNLDKSVARLEETVFHN